jgi:hypothetical protein
MTARPEPYTTPYQVECEDHGMVALTEAEYDAQMMRPNARWACPECGRRAAFDDANWEGFMALEQEDLETE